MNIIAKVLLIIGGLNWLLVGVTPNGWDVGQLFGPANNPWAKIIYILVGLAAIWAIFSKGCKCSAKSETPTQM